MCEAEIYLKLIIEAYFSLCCIFVCQQDPLPVAEMLRESAEAEG